MDTVKLAPVGPIKLTVLGKEYELPDNSPQSIFDHVAARLLEQKAQSISPYIHTNGDCAYRGMLSDTGIPVCCAAGWLIHDENFNPELNALSVDQDEAAQMFESSLGLTHDEAVESGIFALVRGLQLIHDLGRPQDWQVRLRMFAADHKLDAKILDGAN